MKKLLLVGAGHAHAQVLLEFARQKVRHVQLILVSPFERAPYSGMVPGWLAGHYNWEECCIDFKTLCQRAHARLVISHAKGIDTERSELILDDGSTLSYDWLSLNIGSTLMPPETSDVRVLPMRPLADLHARWHALLHEVGTLRHGASYRLAMIGGGAAGVESILAVHQKLTRLAPTVRLEFTLATHGERLVPGLAKGAARRLQRHLADCDIQVVKHFSASQIDGQAIVSTTGVTLTVDAVLWATGAQAPPWLAQTGLATDERGFIRIDSMLRSVSHKNIFAVGDCTSWTPSLPKAGVYAVRMGPVLAKNLLASIDSKPLHTYVPQRRYLVLIGTGGLYAVASWARFAWQGRWVWNWKERIDRRFIRRYNSL